MFQEIEATHRQGSGRPTHSKVLWSCWAASSAFSWTGRSSWQTNVHANTCVILSLQHPFACALHSHRQTFTNSCHSFVSLGATHPARTACVSVPYQMVGKPLHCTIHRVISHARLVHTTPCHPLHSRPPTSPTLGCRVLWRRTAAGGRCGHGSGLCCRHHRSHGHCCRRRQPARLQVGAMARSDGGCAVKQEHVEVLRGESGASAC